VKLPPQPSRAKLQYHEVAAGDTLYSISKQYNLGLEELLKMNRMKPDAVIVPGQQVVVGN
jgi:LysM repeat protein